MPILRDYRDREIRFTDERLAHAFEHPELRGLESSVSESLEKPDVVVVSRADSQVCLYYRLYNHPRLGEKYICVVVKENASDSFVITAYLTDRVKAGERLWPGS